MSKLVFYLTLIVAVVLLSSANGQTTSAPTTTFPTSAATTRCFIIPREPSIAVTWSYNYTDVYEQVVYLRSHSFNSYPRRPTDNGKGVGWKLLRKRWHNLVIDQAPPVNLPPSTYMYHFWYNPSTNSYTRAFLVKGFTTGAVNQPATSTDIAVQPTLELVIAQNVTLCASGVPLSV
eukprot:TRINITY_DN397_c0_g2_i1.p1 TRINITY_DN397_c0_g2~~TRINITY_DN397_c0_g2_i1.p1  ORF type:complete len:176 (+),score=31.10 TRINITY_DN397_c0_g2_i1:244-771(+)